MWNRLAIYRLACSSLRLSTTPRSFTKRLPSLFSLRTVGSIDVERRIKPVKENILTKKRNCLLDPKGVALYRASENLMASKKRLGKKITDSL